jgi:hypothetical protein
MDLVKSELLRRSSLYRTRAVLVVLLRVAVDENGVQIFR